MKNALLKFLKIFRIFINSVVVIFPWKIKRFVLVTFYHYDIAETSYIGFAYIYPNQLVMEEGAIIKHLNVAVNLDKMILKKNALIDRSNWITGYPTNTKSLFFQNEVDRNSTLIMRENSVITKKHHLDCTNRIDIGKFVTIAGYNSQFLTHSINPNTNRQESKPITIGDYCFISTRVIILGGASLPEKSILGAGAVLNKDYSNDFPLGLYVGIPARRKSEVKKSSLYFQREIRDVF